MFKLDLKDAYFAVPIHPPHRKHLAFKWAGQDFHFTSGCAVWDYEASSDLPQVNGGQDGDLLDLPKDDLIQQGGVIQDLQENLGSLVNYPKSELEPSPDNGLLVKTITMKLLLPKEKFVETVRGGQDLLHSTCSYSQWASQQYYLPSYTTCGPPLLYTLHYRGLQEDILRTGGYNTSLPLMEDQARWT